MLQVTEFYYFSPTGGTRKAGELFCQGISREVKEVNLGSRTKEAEQPSGETVVAAVPVFGGRIPEFAAEKLKKLEGKGKKAVTLVVYGTRAYEDALLELNNIMKEQGFQVIASAALVAQHSMAPEVGAGRPDDQDAAEIRAFAEKVLQKLETGECMADSVAVPGNDPYKQWKAMPVTPISLPSCHRCGACAAVCPVGAIHLEEETVATDQEACMLCMACTAACPEHARILPPPVQERMGQMLGALKGIRRENEYFV